MRATEVLQKCLGSALGSMHALRSRVLLRAVEATIHGRRLTLIDLARAWPHAERVRAPLKAMDRLLGNRLLHAERGSIYAAMSRWLARNKRPVIVIDWSDLKSDGSWHPSPFSWTVQRTAVGMMREHTAAAPRAWD